MSLYFIRHGQSQGNLDRIFAGQRYDCDLTDKGRKEAYDSGVVCARDGIVFTTLFVSPLLRTQETARHFLLGYGAEVQKVLDPRLMEYDCGDLSGKSCDLSSEEIEQFSESEEGASHFHDRVAAFLRDYRLRDSSKHYLLVSHGGVGRMIQCIDTGSPLDTWYTLPSMSNVALRMI